MGYVALYRRWRPQDFDNLVGQEHISKTLKNALATGKIAHAFLFAGPRGTGKTSTAKILAKALNCDHGPTPTPCNACPNCERITAGTSMDVFEVDAASNRGIDEIRDLRETVKFAPVDGRYKVYIIDEVHMLTTEAFNALLKTLEEPPPHVVFILATTEAHKIPATIHSRCQRYDFHRIGVKEIVARLTEVADQSGLDVTEEALKLIAIHADGGLRDALSVLDQCAALDEDGITADKVRQLLGLIGHQWVWRLTESLADRDARAVLLGLDELINLGKDVRQVLLEMALHIRSLMLFKAAPDMENIELYSEDRTVLKEHSAKFTHSELVKMIQTLNEAVNEIKWAPEPRIPAEMALLSICRRTSEKDFQALVERVAALEGKLAGGGTAVAKVAAAAVNPVLPSIPQQTAASVPPVVKKASLANSVPSAVNAPPTAAPAVFTPPAEQEQGQETANVKEVWDRVLKELIASGKRSVHACVAQGQLVSLTDRQAVIQFAAAFPKERTAKADYRGMVEKVFNDVCGKPVQVQCTLGSMSPPQAAVRPPKPVPAPQEDPEEQHPALRQAVKLFGGKVIKQEKSESN
ncbi:MAG: DNA polymerase III subunit gamma/tau [Veillonellales bacterium]